MKTRSVKCAAVLAAIVVVQVGLGAPAWAEKSGTRREAYVGGSATADLVVNATGFCRTRPGLYPNPAAKNVGRVCFTDVTPGTYKITVHDATGQDVGFIPIWDGEWNNSYHDFECNTVTLTRTRYASELLIFLEGPIGHGGGPSPLYCQRNGLPYTPGFATTGEVTLTKISAHRR